MDVNQCSQPVKQSTFLAGRADQTTNKCAKVNIANESHRAQSLCYSLDDFLVAELVNGAGHVAFASLKPAHYLSSCSFRVSNLQLRSVILELRVIWRIVVVWRNIMQ